MRSGLSKKIKSEIKMREEKIKEKRVDKGERVKENERDHLTLQKKASKVETDNL